MRVAVVRVSWTVGLLALILSTFAAKATTQDPERSPLARLLVRAGEQVRHFEEQFALVVSDEDYRQHASGQVMAPKGDRLPGQYSTPFRPLTAHRRTLSEMLFLWLPEDAVWLTVRNVRFADGQAVAGSQRRLNEAFAETGARRMERLRELVNESARFNVGRTFRNFNYPTQVLSYLDPALQSRFDFKLSGRERSSGVAVWKVTYDERATPTVIRGDGHDLRSRGAVWIADEDGSIVRTLLRLTIASGEAIGTASVDVRYRHHLGLAMWVPSRMVETYVEMKGATVTERIAGEATYTNVRHFETSGRLVEPQ